MTRVLASANSSRISGLLFQIRISLMISTRRKASTMISRFLGRFHDNRHAVTGSALATALVLWGCSHRDRSGNASASNWSGVASAKVGELLELLETEPSVPGRERRAAAAGPVDLSLVRRLGRYGATGCSLPLGTADLR